MALHCRFVRVVGVVVMLASAACSDPLGQGVSPSGVPSASSSQSAPRPAERCRDAFVEGEAQIVPVGNSLGGVGILTLAGVTGTFRSVIDSASASGNHGQGAQHITLHHDFEAAQGTFRTEDRAVCAPAGADPNVCHVNDILNITGGSGVFANATGQLQNHGIIDLNTFTLVYSIRGRICGDGL